MQTQATNSLKTAVDLPALNSKAADAIADFIALIFTNYQRDLPPLERVKEAFEDLEIAQVDSVESQIELLEEMFYGSIIREAYCDHMAPDLFALVKRLRRLMQSAVILSDFLELIPLRKSLWNVPKA